MLNPRPLEPALVLLNSFGTTSMMWAELEEALVDSGIHVITTALPGHGPRGRVPENEEWDLAFARYGELVAHTARDYHVHLCGVSWGGSIAVELAAKLADDVRTVTAVNAPLRQPDPGYWLGRADEVETTGLDGIARGSVMRMLSEDFRESHPERAAQLQGELAGLDPRGYAHAARILARVDIEDSARRVSVPSLVLGSEHDQAVAVDNSRALAGMLGAPLHLHPTAGHLLPVEAPLWVAQRVLEFVAVHSNDASPRETGS